MKNFKQLLYLLTIVSIFEACQKAPTACFTTDKISAAVNEPIKCDATCSKNAKKFVWLGEGTVVANNGSASIVTYTYPYPGTYLIKLEVTNGGKEALMAHAVTIY